MTPRTGTLTGRAAGETHTGQNFEEPRLELLAKRNGEQCENACHPRVVSTQTITERGTERERALTDRENEAPPSHVEREPARSRDHSNSNNEPDDRETPEDQTKHDADHVEGVARSSHMR